jgi:hypothetical protein
LHKYRVSPLPFHPGTAQHNTTQPNTSQYKPTLVLDKVAHLGPSCENELGHVFDDLIPLLGGVGEEPLGEADLALLAHKEDVVDLPQVG